jgi:hypothetical protein
MASDSMTRKLQQQQFVLRAMPGISERLQMQRALPTTYLFDVGMFRAQYACMYI